jgi:glycosyltransferase involved in cell wall biosynthesis
VTRNALPQPFEGPLTFVRRDPGAETLVVTNVWPEPDRPVYGAAVQREVEALAGLGVPVDVLYVRGYASGKAYPLAAVWFLLSSVAWRGRYRIVHVHTGEAGLAARFHVGTPMLITYAGDDLLGDRDESGALRTSARIRRGVVRLHSRLFSGTITQSAAMERALPAARRSVNHIVPTGVYGDAFAPIDRAEARGLLGWGDEPVALFAATKPFSPAKRLGLAREAAERAGVRLEVAAGVPPERMPLLMNAADCLLVTSAVEGSPNVVKEALMCNLPVIATEVGDIPERLSGVEPSWLCPPDAGALASALSECVALGRRSNGREAAAAFEQTAIARRVLAVHEELRR